MKATISLRVGTPIWDTPARLDELMTLLDNYRDTIDEVAFFTGFTHPPLPLNVLQQRAVTMGNFIPRFKALGLRVGINHLATIGHLDENLEHSLNEPWQHLVDASGAVSPSCYCASDPRHQAYVREVYIAFAKAGPEFIWIDDDIRMESHQQSIRFACFCDLCMARFSAQVGATWTREALVAAFNTGTADERYALRSQWLEHNRQYIDTLFTQIRSAVDEVNPAIKLGYMVGEIPYSGWGSDRHAHVLAGPNNVEVKWRPGGGFYADNAPFDLLAKAHTIGRITASLPDAVIDVQSEHENFPYQPLAKSNMIFAAEIGAYIGAGCTGTALNLMGITPDPFDEYVPRFEAVRKRRGFFDRAVKTIGRSPTTGISVPFKRDHFAALKTDGDWFAATSWGADMAIVQELSTIGLPIGYPRSGGTGEDASSPVVILRADTVREFTDDELRGMLSGGALLDGPALQALNARGMGDLTGFTVCGSKDRDTIEQLSHDALNGRFGGWHRDCRPSFWPEPAWLLEPTHANSRVLAELIDFTPRSHGPVSGIFENALGGRVAIQGYYPYASLQSLAKCTQTKTVARWLSKDTLPAYISSFHKAALWCRRDDIGHTIVMLLNTSLDTVDNLTLRMRGVPELLQDIRDNNSEGVVNPAGSDGAYTEYRIGKLAPWEMALICPM